MIIRRLGLSLAALAAVCPAVSQAWPAKSSLDACVNAFEKTLAQPEDASHAFKVVYRREQFESSIADYFSTSYTFDLQATNVKTGEVLARVRCKADRGGIVALSPLPLLDARETPARVAQR
jgi:hypothetical protein